MITLTRVINSSITYGVLHDNDKPLCVTLELPWRNNLNDVSCIPKGIYQVEKTISAEKNKQVGGVVYHIKGVPNRDGILIHIGNFTSDTKGCILVGMSFGDNQIIDSVAAMQKIISRLPDNFTIEIK